MAEVSETSLMNAMSGVSSLSVMDSQKLAMTSSLEGESDDQKLLMCAVIVCLLLAIIGGAILVTSWVSSSDADDGDAGNSPDEGGPSGGSSGGPSGTNLPGLPVEVRIPGPRTSSPTSGLVSPPPTMPVKELVCTIGGYTTQAYMFPPDGLCHFVIYYKMFLMNGTLHGTRDDYSWSLFQERVRLYSTTKGGIAFDIAYADPKLIGPAQITLRALALQGNIANYGILDILAKSSTLPPMMLRARAFLSALRQMQESKKLFLAFGVYDLTEAGALAVYKNFFVQAVNTYDVDTVFAITSLNEIPDGVGCSFYPTSFKNTVGNMFLGINDLQDELSLRTQYTNEMTVVGVSLQMGALIYTLTDDFVEFGYDALLLKGCDGASLSNPDSACKARRSFDFAVGRIGLVLETDKKLGFIMENKRSITEKVNSINSWNATVRKRFSWLVFNVDFDNAEMTSCGEAYDFVRVKHLKQLFGIP